LVSGENQGFKGVNAVTVNRDFESSRAFRILSQGQAFDQPSIIEASIIDTTMVRIPKEVIHAICIDLPRNDVAQYLELWGELSASLDDVRNQVRTIWEIR
jgi:hypothetical protein